MTSESFERFLALPDQDRRNVFEAAADRLDTLAGYVEKDFWVCLVLNALYNRLPEGHPQLLFDDWLFDVGNLHVIEPSRTYCSVLN